MTRPTYIGNGTMQAVAAAAMTAPWTAGHQIGDIGLFPMEGGSAPGLATANGFVRTGDAPQSATASILDLYWCRATSTTMASPVTNAFGNHGYGGIFTVRGCVPAGDPIHVTSGGIDNVSNTSLSATGDTTTIRECLVMFFVGKAFDSAAAQLSAESCAGVSNLVEQHDLGTATGNGGGIGVYTAELDTPGAYGPLLATLANASVKSFISIALMPAVSLVVPPARSFRGLRGR